MAKPRTLFNQAYNECLDLLAEREQLPSEPQLSAILQVSRTTVRSILNSLNEAALIDWTGREKRVLRRPRRTDYFTEAETKLTADIVERWFLEKILVEDAAPGRSINELEMAREIGVATGTVREFLIRFSRFGLIEKRRNSTWVLKGFTREFAMELADVREMFELRSALRFAALPDQHPSWQALVGMEAEHRALRHDPRRLNRVFSELDERFHRLIHSASQNRFITDFYDVIAMVFHYHYQWNKQDEGIRNRAAIEEHLSYIAALRSHDPTAVERACNHHLRSARQTLISSIRFDGQAATAGQSAEPVRPAGSRAEPRSRP